MNKPELFHSVQRDFKCGGVSEGLGYGGAHRRGVRKQYWALLKIAIRDRCLPILPGGGVALLRAGKALDKLKGENEDQRHGIEMVKKALSGPTTGLSVTRQNS